MTLNELFDDLDRYPSPVSAEELREVMERLEVGLGDVNDALCFGEKKYRRTLLHQGRAYEALLMCWKNGQRSPIHDHRASVCGVRVIAGSATETKFEISASGYLRPAETATLSQGETMAAEDADIHQVSNLQEDGSDLVTLHIYSPPLKSMGSYRTESRHGEESFQPAVHSDRGAVVAEAPIRMTRGSQVDGISHATRSTQNSILSP